MLCSSDSSECCCSHCKVCERDEEGMVENGKERRMRGLGL